jgi:hypothetical protein
MKTVLILVFAVVLCTQAIAQEGERKEHKPKIRGAIMMANSHVPNATEGGTAVVVIPAWGFDVDYYFHPRWSVALQGDVLLQSFEVEDSHTDLERSYPFAIVWGLHYHALRHWSFYVGPGYEFESHENLLLLRIGTEYSFEITEDFEIALNLIYDNKEEVYDTWTLGIAFNKRLWEKK